MPHAPGARRADRSRASATRSRSSTRAPTARKASTTMVFVRLLSKLLRDKKIGKLIVPIVPDEARTFGMEALFRQVGIYSHVGQLYEPVDSRHAALLQGSEGRPDPRRRHQRGRLDVVVHRGGHRLRDARHQHDPVLHLLLDVRLPAHRRPDLGRRRHAHARASCSAAPPAARRSNGEGLQHQDGHSHVLALPVPNCAAYDPAFAYELAVIIEDGIKRMYDDQEDIFYYLTLMNENYEHAADARRRRRTASSRACTCCKPTQQAEGEAARAAVRQRHDPAARRSRRSRSSRRSTASAPTSGA